MIKKIEKYKPRLVKLNEVRYNNWNPRQTMGMIYGLSGCGKTSEFEKMTNEGLKVFVIDCDMGGQTGKKIASNSVDSYEGFMDVVFSIKKDYYDIIVIDSVDVVATRFIRKRLMNDKDVSHPGDIAFGIGWDYEVNLFREILSLLASKNAHTICVGHCKEKEEVTASGKKVNKIIPSIRGTLFNEIVNNCIYVVYLEIFGSKRILRTECTEKYFARDKSRIFPSNNPEISLTGLELTNVFVNVFKEKK